MPKRPTGSRQSRSKEWAEQGRLLAEAMSRPDKQDWPRTHAEILPIVEENFSRLNEEELTPMAVTNFIYAWLQAPDRRR